MCSERFHSATRFLRSHTSRSRLLTSLSSHKLSSTQFRIATTLHGYACRQSSICDAITVWCHTDYSDLVPLFTFPSCEVIGKEDLQAFWSRHTNAGLSRPSDQARVKCKMKSSLQCSIPTKLRALGHNYPFVCEKKKVQESKEDLAEGGSKLCWYSCRSAFRLNMRWSASHWSGYWNSTKWGLLFARVHREI